MELFLSHTPTALRSAVVDNPTTKSVDSQGSRKLSDPSCHFAITASPAIAAIHNARVAQFPKDARQQQLAGKKVLFICCGHGGLDSKQFVFEMAHSLGVRSFLVEDANNTLASSLEKAGLLEQFIRVDMQPRASLVDSVMEALRSSAHGGFDGVCTFWDDAVGLAARVAERLNLRCSPVKSNDIAHDKHLTRLAMRESGLPTPSTFLIKSQSDLQPAGKTVPMPSILKPMYGASSLAVIRVDRIEDLNECYRRVIHQLQHYYQDGDLMGLTFGENEAGNSFKESSLSWLVLEECLEGPEVDVDLVLQNGKAIYSCVVDDWPQIEPWFAEMGNNCPSSLPTFDQDSLIAMALETSTKCMGFTDGVLHCELKLTSNGPRIIEVNPRMGGGPVWALHKLAYGLDFVEETLYAALGIPGVPSLPKSPKFCVSCGEKFFKHSMNVPVEFCKIVQAIRLFPNVIEATALVAPGEKIVGIDDGFPTRAARFIVFGRTPLEAQAYAQRLLDICDIPQAIRDVQEQLNSS